MANSTTRAENGIESSDETLAGPYSGYSFSEGDRVIVDWTEGQGPWDEISGIVDEIGSFRRLRRDDIVVSVTNYDDPDWTAHGRTFGCAPEWITVIDE